MPCYPMKVRQMNRSKMIQAAREQGLSVIETALGILMQTRNQDVKAGPVMNLAFVEDEPGSGNYSIKSGTENPEGHKIGHAVSKRYIELAWVPSKWTQDEEETQGRRLRIKVNGGQILEPEEGEV